MAEERTLAQLVTEASEDLSHLVRYELALAKAEIRDDVKRVGLGAGLFGAAGYLALLSSITLVIMLGYLLVAWGLSPWAAFGVVTLILLLLAGALVGVGVLLLRRVQPPTRAIASTQQTIAAVRGISGRG